MNNALQIQEKKTHTHILQNLQLFGFLQTAVSQVAGIVLKVKLSIGKWSYSVVAVIFGKIRANFVPDEKKKIELIFQRNWNFVLKTSFPD